MVPNLSSNSSERLFKSPLTLKGVGPLLTANTRKLNLLSARGPDGTVCFLAYR